MDSPRRYRLTVLACAAAWFLVGLHAPALPEMVDHGRARSAARPSVVC